MGSFEADCVRCVDLNVKCSADRLRSTVKKDQHGVEHMIMHFHAEGPLNKGVISLHLEKRATAGSDYEYRYLKLDVKGHSTVYLEGGTAKNVGKGVSKLFGVRWR